MKTLLFLFSFVILTSCASQKQQHIKSEEEIAEECLFPKYSQEVSSLIWSNDNELILKIQQNQINKNARGSFCRTMAHEAVRDTEFLEKLINLGVPFDEKDSMGDTPIIEAVYSKNLKSMDFLLQKGVKTYQKHSFDSSLFFHAIERFPLSLDLLIKYNVCPFGTGFMDKTLEDVIAPHDLSFQEKILNYKKNYKTNDKNCIDNSLKKK